MQDRRGDCQHLVQRTNCVVALPSCLWSSHLPMCRISLALTSAHAQGIGVVLASMRQGLKYASHAARRQMLVTLEMTSKDVSYPWFLGWMAHQTALARAVPAADRGLLGALRGRVNQLPSHELAVETSVVKHKNGTSEAAFELIPGPGRHYFAYGGHWFQVKRERDSKLMDFNTGAPFETLTVTGLSSSRTILPQLLDEARALAEKGTVGKTVVYTAWGVEWRPFGNPRSRRELGSVVLAAGVAERVERDIKAFLGRRQWYTERGEFDRWGRASLRKSYGSRPLRDLYLSLTCGTG